MTWAGESGPTTSGLYVFTDDGSPGELVGNPGDLVMWEQGVPKFMPQVSVTGSAPLSLSQIQDVDINGLVNGQVLKWNAASGAWVASSDIAGSGSVNSATPPTTNNAVVRWDGTTGDMIQNSNVIISDADDVTTSGTFDGGSFSVDGIPLNINHLADVSTSGIDAPNVGEFLGWDGSLWRPTEINQNVGLCAVTGATDVITTTSESYTPMPNMSLTPSSGTYLMWFSASASMNKNGQFIFAQIFVDGSPVTYSQRRIGGQSNNIGNFNCQARASVNGSQAISVRWYITSAAGGGVGTVYSRTLMVAQCTPL